jgi:hypothetical protein
MAFATNSDAMKPKRIHLRHDRVNRRSSFDPGQTLIKSIDAYQRNFVVDAKCLQNLRFDIADLNRIWNDIVRKIVRPWTR